jgi:hypothetical protein
MDDRPIDGELGELKSNGRCLRDRFQMMEGIAEHATTPLSAKYVP